MKKILLVLMLACLFCGPVFAANKIIFPIGYYPNPTKLGNLSLGELYIGEPDTDPTVAGNQKTVTALQENGTSIAISQPINLSAGGVPVYNGSYVSLFVEGKYSMSVLDSSDVQQYYIADSSIDPTGSIADVTEYGAVGDGITDDTSAIQDAIDSTSKYIYFPSGTYNHTGLTLKKECIYAGDGMESSILVHTGSGGNSVAYVGGAAAKIQIKDLWIKGNGTDTAKTVSLTDAYFNSFMIRCRVTGGVINVYLKDSWTFEFNGCHMYGTGNGDAGITENNIYTDGFENGKILNCRLEDVLEDIVYIDKTGVNDSNYFNIQNSSLQRSGDRALYVVSGGGRVNIYMEDINQDNATIAAIEFLVGGYTEITNTYLTGSGGKTKFCEFIGNGLSVIASHQSTSGGNVGVEVNAPPLGVTKLLTLGNRFNLITPYDVDNTTSWINLDQTTEIAIENDSLLIGDKSELDSTSYSLDIYAEGKNTRITGDGNFIFLLNALTDRQLSIGFQASDNSTVFIGRGDSDVLANTIFFVDEDPNTSDPAFGVDVSNGNIHMGQLPTSAAGLSSGDLWSNSNVITIVP